MNTYNIDFFCSNSRNREEVRERVILKFLEEIPGTGNKECASKYNYFVETLSDGRKIFLSRPANLNKGFDFVIKVENQVFSNRRNYPRHIDIQRDLELKKTQNNVLYNDLYETILDIYNCIDIPAARIEQLDNFNGSLPIDMVLGLIKWFFIEQDVTYWNWSGRQMFMNNIPRP